MSSMRTLEQQQLITQYLEPKWLRTGTRFFLSKITGRGGEHHYEGGRGTYHFILVMRGSVKEGQDGLAG